jgi:hypothetical protein
MRLVTFQRSNGAAGIGVIAGGEVISLDSAVFPDMTSFLSGGSSALAEARKAERGETLSSAKSRLSDVKLLAPVTRPGKIRTEFPSQLPARLIKSSLIRA